MRNICLGAVALIVTACSSTSAQQPKRQTPSDVVALVGSTSITLSEIDEKAMQQPVGSFGSMKLSQAIYEARRVALDDAIANRLIDDAAKAQHVDRAALIDKEITSKIATVSDADIQTWYQANQQRVQGAPLEQVKQPIRAYLTQQRMQDVREAYLETLKAKTSIKMMLDPPRQSVASSNSPSKGSAKAPIEIVEFSDFQCPFCLRANPTVTEVLKTYGDRIHFVYRHYPLPNHPNARPAAEAAACAAEQDKFWQYHDVLFANPSKLARRRSESARRGAWPRHREIQCLRGHARHEEGGGDRYRGRSGCRSRRHAGVLHQRPDDQRCPAVRRLQEDHRRRTQREEIGVSAAVSAR